MTAIHMRLLGVVRVKDNQVALHITIEEGGAVLDKGKVLWEGFISIESFRDVVAEAKRFIES